MYLNYLKNNLILSAVFGVLAIILSFIESKRSKEKYTFKSYFKIFVLVTICCYILIYVKSSSFLNNGKESTLYGGSAPWANSGPSNSVNIDNYSSVNIGEPNF